MEEEKDDVMCVMMMMMMMCVDVPWPAGVQEEEEKASLAARALLRVFVCSVDALLLRKEGTPRPR